MAGVLLQVSSAQHGDLAMNTSREKGFANGDAVVVDENGFRVTGVVSEVYDDVVAVEYVDELGQMDTLEFHESFVEPII